mmetsp:Transcript_27422/g.27814  ORF Transcript_27422/g.27814 Transcript_27422/m.27814 type:complete len:91 (-) Transcript_27422:111-383(-)
MLQSMYERQIKTHAQQKRRTQTPTQPSPEEGAATRVLNCLRYSHTLYPVSASETHQFITFRMRFIMIYPEITTKIAKARGDASEGICNLF